MSFVTDEAAFGLDRRDGALVIGGVDCRRFLEQHDSAYVYDLNRVRRQVDALSVLPSGVSVHYALKANPALALVRFLSQLGLGLDVASHGELLCAQAARHDMNRTVVTGPAKRPFEIRACVATGVRFVNVESLSEAQTVSDAAVDLRQRQDVLLRVNTSFEVTCGAIRTTGGPQKFGIDQEVLEGVARQVMEMPGVRLAGIHCFSASNVLDADVLAHNAERVLQLAQDLEGRLGVRFDAVDVGGGIGIPYAQGQTSFDVGRFAESLDAARASYDRPLILELGRFLVGPAGYYLTRVLDVKESRGRQVVLTAGGINHQLRPALMGPHPLTLANRVAERTVPSLVGGPLCTSVDAFLPDGPFAQSRDGDVIAVLQSGAYGYTEGMGAFLSFDSPPEFCVQGGVAKMTREAVTAESRLDGQVSFDAPSENDAVLNGDAHV